MAMAPCTAATAQYLNKNHGAAIGASIAGSSIWDMVFPIALGKRVMLFGHPLIARWTPPNYSVDTPPRIRIGACLNRLEYHVCLTYLRIH